LVVVQSPKDTKTTIVEDEGAIQSMMIDQPSPITPDMTVDEMAEKLIPMPDPSEPWVDEIVSPVEETVEDVEPKPVAMKPAATKPKKPAAKKAPRKTSSKGGSRK
jgi:hypothetical protein